MTGSHPDGYRSFLLVNKSRDNLTEPLACVSFNALHTEHNCLAVKVVFCDILHIGAKVLRRNRNYNNLGSGYGIFQVRRNLNAVGEGEVAVPVLVVKLKKIRRVLQSAGHNLVSDSVKIPSDAASPASAAQY